MSAKPALKKCTVDHQQKLAFIALCLSFGGAPNPSFWGNISETTNDLANTLMKSEDWDPAFLHSTHQHLLPLCDKDISKKEFAQAQDLAIPLVAEDCKADVYIDDITTVTIEEFR